jgi:hypothetical protein
VRLSTLLPLLVLIWAVSAVLSGWLAGRKARDVRRWVLLGAILGPLSLIIQALYPARFVPTVAPCPQCGKPIATRAVACYHCQYRFPALDVMITTVPDDPESRRAILNEVAREYGITYADAGEKLATLPFAGYRHVQPDQVDEFVRRLERVGASVTVVPSPERRAAR